MRMMFMLYLQTQFLWWGKNLSLAIVMLVMSTFPLPLAVSADETEDRLNYEKRACESVGWVWVNDHCEEPPPPPEPTDICPNVAGDQTDGPCEDETCSADGGTWTGESCDLPSAAPPVDVCPNVSGTHTVGPC